MRRYVLSMFVGALLAVSAAGTAVAAGGEGPVSILMPSTEFLMEGAFTPKTLSKTEPTPISWLTSGSIKDNEGGLPPALRELTMEIDEAIAIDTDGIPACPRRELGETTETTTARERCRSALIGEGEATVVAAFPENTPISVLSKLLVFNGGERDGTTTLLIHAYFGNPISSSVVIPVKIARQRGGSSGSLAVAKIPQIRGGVGSFSAFEFRIFRSVKVDGERLSPITATCSDGELRVGDFGRFEDGTKFQTEVVRGCTGRG